MIQILLHLVCDRKDLFNGSLQHQLSQAQNTLRASSCVLYIRDPEFPGEFRLIALSGVRFEEPMFGFVYTESARQLLAGDGEIFQTYSDTEKTQSSFPTSEIPEQHRHLFGDFREREHVHTFARLTEHSPPDKRTLILFVNYSTAVQIDDRLKRSMRNALADLATTVRSSEVELISSDVQWRTEATRIVSPAQTITSMSFHTLDEPSVYFNKVIEAALKELNIPSDSGLGVIHLYNAELQELELRGHVGDVDLNRAYRQSVRKGEGVISWVALTKRALFIQDLQNSEFSQIHVWINENTKCELTVPLEVGGELVGTMCLECIEPNMFKPHHAYSVWYAANKAALAYQLCQLSAMNKKLLNLCWRATAIEGGARVSLDDVATLAKEYLKASSCDISRYNSDSGTFDTGGASFTEFVPDVRENGWTHTIRRANCPIWISEISNTSEFTVHHWKEDEWVPGPPYQEAPADLHFFAIRDGVRSALGIPITILNNCVGVAWVKYKRAGLECPMPGLMSLAVGFAAQAGLVLDSIQRQEVDLRERAEIDSVGDQIAIAIRERWQLNDSAIVEAAISSYPFHWKLGGDYYAGKIIDTDTVGILLVDGQGHGVAGSLHMLPLMTTFESVSQSYSTAHVVSRLAKTADLLGFKGSVIYCIITFLGGKKWLSATSAGHESLIVFHSKERDRWSVTFFPEYQAPMLGHPVREPFLDQHVELKEGDLLVGYTDGVAAQHEPFDADTIAGFVTKLLHKQLTPQQIADGIVEEARKQHPRGFDDDATAFVLRVK